jgi:putative flippase GtrA
MKLADGAHVPIWRKHRRFVSFVVVGGIAAAVNVLSRIALNLVMSYEIAIIFAYICGMTTAYILNKGFVFSQSGRAVHDEYFRFTIVNVVAAAQVWIVSVGLARFIFPWLHFDWHADTIAHAIGVVIPVFTSYLGHKHFSFAAVK